MLLQENLLIKSSHNSFPCFAYSQGKKLWQPIPKCIKFMIKLANCIGNPSLNASNLWSNWVTALIIQSCKTFNPDHNTNTKPPLPWTLFGRSWAWMRPWSWTGALRTRPWTTTRSWRATSRPRSWWRRRRTTTSTTPLSLTGRRTWLWSWTPVE